MVAAQAPTARTPWLLGGDTVSRDGVIHVAAWSAASPTGPWQAVGLDPVPGRDGPNETVLGFAPPVGSGPLVMFGSRRSPTEGYPRPSAWTAATGPALAFHEVLADRELFGGPDIVSIGTYADGGLTSGPHGYHIAGTWAGPGDADVASVWGAPAAGRPWTRNSTDPAFLAESGQQAFGADIADNAAGLLMVGDIATPSPADPTAQVGARWYSSDGLHWRRLDPLPSATLSAVRDLGDGWVAGGAHGGLPAVWEMGSDLSAPPATVLPGTGSVTDLAVAAGRVWAAGISSSGAPELWTAPVGSHRWRAVALPPAGTIWDQARLAAGVGQLVLVVFNGDVSAVWRTTLR